MTRERIHRDLGNDNLKAGTDATAAKGGKLGKARWVGESIDEGLKEGVSRAGGGED